MVRVRLRPPVKSLGQILMLWKKTHNLTCTVGSAHLRVNVLAQTGGSKLGKLNFLHLSRAKKNIFRAQVAGNISNNVQTFLS